MYTNTDLECLIAADTTYIWSYNKIICINYLTSTAINRLQTNHTK